MTDPGSGDLLARARGALLGLAVGDALGGPVEFMTPGEIAAKYGTLKEMTGGGWLRLKAGQVTDDTEMSLCIARAVTGCGGWDLEAIAKAFATWLKGKPLDVGDTCRRGIRAYMLHGTLETPVNEWDAGNGALMRMAPVALCTMGDGELLTRQTLAQAHLTHNHPLSDAACLTYGRMLHLALAVRSRNAMRREADQLIEQFPNFSITNYRGLATGYVVDTMQTVLHYFFRSRSFEEAVVTTVNQGGDADTTGAIIGALAGAYYGPDEIPKRWLKKLDRKLLEELQQLADGLIKISPAGGTGQ
jgi:ADP-ribosyl-[dinitrogen reductase] hydrolase